EDATRKLDLMRQAGVPEERVRMSLVGDADTVAEGARGLLDAGLDGLIFNLPDAHDLEPVALLGETLGGRLRARAYARAAPRRRPSLATTRGSPATPRAGSCSVSASATRR